MNPLTLKSIYASYVDNPGKNVVFSPASYLEAMHSLALCVKDKNLEELLAALEMSPDNLEAQIEEFKKALDGLETYNCLLHAAEYLPHMEPVVVEALKRLGSDLKDFATPDSAIEAVNASVREKTHGKIDNLASRDNVNAFTKFIILNCVYFKRDWLHKFTQKHYEETFHGGLEDTQVHFLNELGNFSYYEDSELDIVEIPYKQEDICCYLFVPKEGTPFSILSDFERHYAKINRVSRQLEVNLTVPSFKIETTLDLIPAAKNAGVENIFNCNQDWTLVDLPKLAPGSVMKVQAITQKAFIDFTKDGTEATAATMISMLYASGCYFNPNPPPIKYIRADHPFLFVLANKNYKDTPLFFGAVNNL